MIALLGLGASSLSESQWDFIDNIIGYSRPKPDSTQQSEEWLRQPRSLQ